MYISISNTNNSKQALHSMSHGGVCVPGILNRKRCTVKPTLIGPLLTKRASIWRTRAATNSIVGIWNTKFAHICVGALPFPCPLPGHERLTCHVLCDAHSLQMEAFAPKSLTKRDIQALRRAQKQEEIEALRQDLMRLHPSSARLSRGVRPSTSSEPFRHSFHSTGSDAAPQSARDSVGKHGDTFPHEVG